MTSGLIVRTPGVSDPGPAGYRSGRGWWVVATIILIPAVVPPLALAWQVVVGGATTVVPADRIGELLVGTLALTLAVTATALAIGIGTAWLTTRSDIRARRLWMVLAALPLVIPSYMAALTIIGATGPSGMLNEVLGWNLPTPYGFLGAWLALSLFLAPMAHLILVPALRSIDPATEEAAAGLGASRTRTLLTVTLPQLRPALVSAGLMVGLYTLSDFGAVSLLRFDTMTRAIFTLYAGQIDRTPAATLSVILMAIAILIVLIERRTRKRRIHASTGPPRNREMVHLGRSARVSAYGFLGLLTTLSLVLPLGVFLFWLLNGLGSGAEVSGLWAEAGRSLGVALGAGALAALAAIPIAMVTTWRRRKASDLVDTSVWGVYALPHITVGVAVVAFALQFARPLYQTIALLVVVYVGMFLAQSVGPVQDLLSRSNPDLEDASRGLGRGWIATLRRVTLPLVRPGMLAGAALVFVSVMKELPATLLLRPNEFETLAIRIWSATGEGFYTRASAASLLLVVVSFVPLLVLTNRDLRS